MKNEYWRIMIGALLLVIGIVALLQAIGIIAVGENLFALFASVIFVFAGLVFLSVLVRDHQKWWSAIPGIILLDLGLLIAFSQLFPWFSRIAGGFFLAGLGLSFWVTYFLVPRNWWAIIPGGVFFTLALVAALGDLFAVQSGAIFFLGLALTFGLLSVLPNPGGRKMIWPWYPAAACLVLGLLISLSEARLAIYFWPIALILGGIFLIMRTLIGKEKV